MTRHTAFLLFLIFKKKAEMFLWHSARIFALVLSAQRRCRPSLRQDCRDCRVLQDRPLTNGAHKGKGKRHRTELETKDDYKTPRNNSKSRNHVSKTEKKKTTCPIVVKRILLHCLCSSLVSVVGHSTCVRSAES